MASREWLCGFGGHMADGTRPTWPFQLAAGVTREPARVETSFRWYRKLSTRYWRCMWLGLTGMQSSPTLRLADG
jgi:hypothetical protein